MNLSPGDTLTRFIRHNSHCKGGIVRPDAFIPPNNSVDVSVYIISDLLEPDLLQLECKIWNIAFTCLTTPTVARADILVESVYFHKLNVIPDNSPSRHANITPFPALTDPTCPKSEVNLTDKKDRRALANKLANKSRFVPLPMNT